MNRRTGIVAVAVVATVAGASCTGGSPPAPPTPPPSVRVPGIPVGGVLKTQIVSDVSASFDPQKEYQSSVSFELFRCCLLRTLLATTGQGVRSGGNELHPDLAGAMPKISPDGLRWTFQLKQGIHYAPPLQKLTVTSYDFVRALEREACADCATGGYSIYYGSGALGAGIKGFDDYANGKDGAISGLSTPNGSTLVVSLEHPTGDLGYRFALGATAPIAPNPFRPDDRLGIAEGHTQDYGRFLVGTGPYMFWHQSQLDFSKPPEQQAPIPGYQPGRSINLVRNPSWKSSTDGLRPAYVDGIDVTIGGTPEDVAKKVDSGELDLGLDAPPPSEQLETYSNDPARKQYLHSNRADDVRYLAFNIAIPPFDDVHVRRAINYAIDKNGMRRLREESTAPLWGATATHAIPDGLETISGRPLLEHFDPYATDEHAGDLAKAKAEMRLSKYDTNGDGVCDDLACKQVMSVTDGADPYPGQAALIQDDLAPLGITLAVRIPRGLFIHCNDPASHISLCLSPAWFTDYPDTFTWSPLFSSGGIYPNCCNYGLLGASPDLLRKYHYRVTSVPSVDADIARCEPLIGEPRIRCWADLDRKLMTEIVPWVPYFLDYKIDITSERLRNYTFDSFAGVASLDHLALQAGEV